MYNVGCGTDGIPDAQPVFRTHNIRIIIYPKDHKPAHVHAVAPDAEAKFNIHTLECISNNGFSEKMLRRIRDYLAGQQQRLFEVWDELQE